MEGRKGGRWKNTCEEEVEEEGRKKKEGKERGRELEEWLELYLRRAGDCRRLREVDNETRVLMLAEAMANIDQDWFGGLRWADNYITYIAL